MNENKLNSSDSLVLRAIKTSIFLLNDDSQDELFKYIGELMHNRRDDITRAYLHSDTALQRESDDIEYTKCDNCEKHSLYSSLMCDQCCCRFCEECIESEWKSSPDYDSTEQYPDYLCLKCNEDIFINYKKT